MQGELYKKHNDRDDLIESPGGSQDKPARAARPDGGDTLQPRGQWQQRLFILDPYAQLLREYTGKVALARIDLRGADVQRLGDRPTGLGRAHCFSVRGPNAQLTCSAEDAAECEAWVAALKAASGARELPTSRPLSRSPLALCAALSLCLLVTGSCSV